VVNHHQGDSPCFLCPARLLHDRNQTAVDYADFPGELRHVRQRRICLARLRPGRWDPLERGAPRPKLGNVGLHHMTIDTQLHVDRRGRVDVQCLSRHDPVLHLGDQRALGLVLGGVREWQPVWIRLRHIDAVSPLLRQRQRLRSHWHLNVGTITGAKPDLTPTGSRQGRACCKWGTH
jgi:hypothetical protein